MHKTIVITLLSVHGKRTGGARDRLRGAPRQRIRRAVTVPRKASKCENDDDSLVFTSG